jgi:alpha-tubulin suppressor-like RCC1 family protein
MKTLVTFERASLSRGYGEATIWKSPLHLVMIAAAFLSVTLGQEGIISAGYQFTIVICRDGTARAAGNNSQGQLGAGSTDPYRPTPTQVIQSLGVPLPNIKAVSAGGWHALFLLEDGTVRAVGKNQYGQLGDTTTTNRNIPVPVLGPNNAPLTNIVAVSAGGEHSLFLAADSTVWAVGDNYLGQLGDPATNNQYVRRVVKVKGPDGINPLRGVIAIAAGSSHSLFLTKDGRVWATGRNNEGQLGDGTTQDRSIVVPVVKADGSPFDSVIAIAAGHLHSLFLRQDGSVWAVGNNDAGQLGDGTLQRRLTPVQVKMNDGSFLACKP